MTQYVMSFREEDRKTGETINQHMIPTTDQEMVKMGIRSFINSHPKFDHVTDDEMYLGDTIADLLFSEDNEKKYYMIIHILYI